MKMLQPRVTAIAFVLATLGGVSTPSFAQETTALEEIVTIGSRREGRSAADTTAPVDVIGANDILDQASSDISDLIRTVVPSYQVNTQPISDAATIVRPANLRGLSPDNTLVLLNGKRRHRAAVISFLGGGISDGAHGADIGVFPTIGLKQVEVLRDGASSQYGSDAIAGVMNFVLKDNREGGTIEVKYGEAYEGDGTNVRVAANLGFPLGDEGFFNVSGEFGETDGTFRAVQRDDAATLIANGNTAVASRDVNTVTGDFVQYWGQPDVTDDIKLFFNAAVPVNENMEAYAFGNHAERTVEGGFFFRNPTNRPGVFAGPSVDPVTGAADPNGIASVRVGDLSVNTAGDCPAGIPLPNGTNDLPDPGILAAVHADPNCFSFTEIAPGGFVPRFGGDVEDQSLVLGVRGEADIGSGLGYDVSFTYGRSEAVFFIGNTINASLGPNTPRNFTPGAYEQTDTNFNLDLTYSVPVEGFASELSIAGGIEYREEQFDITAGDPASFAIGPLAAPSSAFPTGQGFSSSSNGFGGFTKSTSDTQDNFGVYIELEADVTEALTLQGAVRYEDFNTFGDTTNFKIGGLYRVNDTTRLRGTFSTGFHAPTTGQANVTNVTTAFTNGFLVDQGTLPLSSPAGQFVNQQLGGQFSLGPEDAENFSIGASFEVGAANVTLDFFKVDVEDRISITDQQDFQGLLAQVATGAGVALPANAQTSQILNALNAAGVLNSADFAGSEDLSSFAFFANDFDTSTQGLDLIVSYPFELGGGASTIALAFNYTDTEVTRRGNLSDTRKLQLEENLPNIKGNISWRHSQNDWRVLTRLNYHGSYKEPHLDSGDLLIFPGSEITIDAEFGYNFNEKFDVIVGAANIFDSFPDENEFAGVAGSRYPATAPFGFTGGQWYVRGRYDF